MKKILFILTIVLFSGAAWADDLVPASYDKAVSEYEGFANSPDRHVNDEVTWKLYIYGVVYGKSTQMIPMYLFAGLRQKPRYPVVLKINNMYNVMHPIPKEGDVIAVNGRFTRFDVFKTRNNAGTKEFEPEVVYLDPLDAVKMPPEPLGNTLTADASPTVIPTITPTPKPLPQRKTKALKPT